MAKHNLNRHIIKNTFAVPKRRESIGIQRKRRYDREKTVIGTTMESRTCRRVRLKTTGDVEGVVEARLVVFVLHAA